VSSGAVFSRPAKVVLTNRQSKISFLSPLSYRQHLIAKQNWGPGTAYHSLHTSFYDTVLTPSKGSIYLELDRHFDTTRTDPGRCHVHHDNIRLWAVNELYCQIPIYVGHHYAGDNRIVIGGIEVLSSSPCTSFRSRRCVLRDPTEVDILN
jgi:hypothetical protein